MSELMPDIAHIFMVNHAANEIVGSEQFVSLILKKYSVDFVDGLAKEKLTQLCRKITFEIRLMWLNDSPDTSHYEVPVRGFHTESELVCKCIAIVKPTKDLHWQMHGKTRNRRLRENSNTLVYAHDGWISASEVYILSFQLNPEDYQPTGFVDLGEYSFVKR